MQLISLTICLMAILPWISALKVAILPAMGNSHVLTMDTITQRLIQRGHQTVTIISNQPNLLKGMKPSPIVTYNMDNPVISGQQAVKSSKLSSIAFIQRLIEIQRQYCEATLSNDTLIQLLSDVDVFVTDSLYICGVLLPEMMGKPNVIISLGADVIGYHTFLGDYIDSTYIPIFGFFHTTKLTIIQRAINAIIKQLLLTTYSYMSSNLMNTLRYKYNISTDLSLFQIRRNPSLFLASCDFALEYSRPLPPYIKVIGPLSPQPASLLPDEFESFMQASDKGVILLSLGSRLQLDQDKVPEMLNALSQLPYSILWKNSPLESSLPNNIKIVNWMPQNDLLGHHKTIAFITHCGANSMYEAAYHGVPLIGMPTMLEQKGNAGRIITGGIGVLVDFHKFTAEDLIQAIQKITSDKRYKENAIKISHILKSRPRAPRDVAVDWIEYVANTNGAHHLKVEGETLWLYEYYNIDVLLLVVAILYLLYRMIKLSKNWLFCQTSKSKND